MTAGVFLNFHKCISRRLWDQFHSEQAAIFISLYHGLEEYGRNAGIDENLYKPDKEPKDEDGKINAAQVWQHTVESFSNWCCKWLNN